MSHELKELKIKSERQEKEIRLFEERYKGIDIGKLHEEIESYKTAHHAAQVGEKAALNDLFTIRDKMLKLAQTYDANKEHELGLMATKKMYRGPAAVFQDPEKTKEIRAREKEARKLQEWKGQESIEQIANMFVTFLTTPTAISAEKLN